MPLPTEARELPLTLTEAQAALDDAIAAAEALPDTPLEADLPDLVVVVRDIAAVAQTLKGVMDTMAQILAKTRINQ